MPVRIAVIAEARADFQHVSELVDRKVREHAPDCWDEDRLEAQREYAGLRPGTSFTHWRELRDFPAARGLLRNGGILDLHQPQRFRFDYPLARKALILCAQAKSRPDVVLLVRDLDRQSPERARSLVAARDEISAKSFGVILALPSAKREAWVLAGWLPRDCKEEVAFAALREELAFHPCECAEKLDAMEHGATREAKRALSALTGGNREREAQCWRETAWATLRARGRLNGLTDFLGEVKEKLVPLILGCSV